MKLEYEALILETKRYVKIYQDLDIAPNIECKIQPNIQQNIETKY